MAKIGNHAVVEGYAGLTQIAHSPERPDCRSASCTATASGAGGDAAIVAAPFSAFNAAYCTGRASPRTNGHHSIADSHLAPDANDFLAVYALARLPGGNLAALRCLDFGSQRCIALQTVHGRGQPIFSLPKKVQLGSFLTGLESPPRRRGSCRRLTTSARGFRACKCHEPRSSVYLVGGGFSWSPQAAAAARNGKQRAMHPPANLCANSPALDFFRTIDSSSQLNSIPTYLATRLGTCDQACRVLARHKRSSLEK